MESGVLPISCSVNSSGEYEISIPIECPPGTGGMEPSISLTYNSNYPSGICGRGWSISGLSTISRTPTSNYLDLGQQDRNNFNIDTYKRIPIKYNQVDKFDLDGSRLVGISGVYGSNSATYRKEIDDASLITSYGNYNNSNCPEYFIVNSSSGIKYKYGKISADSGDAMLFFGPNGTSGIPTSWAIKEKVDKHGNSIYYKYESDYESSIYWISEILYSRFGSNLKSNSIRFIYQNCPAECFWETWSVGNRTVHYRELSEIHVYENTTNVRKYILSYYTDSITKARHLSSISPIAGESQLGPVLFSYAGYTPSFPESSPLDSDNYRDILGWHTDSVGSTPHYFMTEFDNDGRDEIVKIVRWDTAGTETWLAEFYDLKFPDDGSSEEAYLTQKSTRSINYNGMSSFACADYNGDGRSDIITSSTPAISATSVYYMNSITDIIYTHPTSMNSSIGEASFQVFAETFSKSGSPTSTTNKILPLDFNGDGRKDLLILRNINYYSYPTCAIKDRLLLATSTGYQPVANLSPQYTKFLKDSNNNYPPEYFCRDFNNDGLDDLAISYAKQVSGRWDLYYRLYFSTGDKLDASVYLDCQTNIAALKYSASIPCDINGDGLLDFLYIHCNDNADWGVAKVLTFTNKGLNNSSMFANTGETSYNFWKWLYFSHARQFSSYNRFSIADHNQDGKDDLIVFRPNMYGCSTAVLLSDGLKVNYNANMDYVYNPDRSWYTDPILFGNVDGNNSWDFIRISNDTRGAKASPYLGNTGIGSVLTKIEDCHGKETRVAYDFTTNNLIYSEDVESGEQYPIQKQRGRRVVVSELLSDNGLLYSDTYGNFQKCFNSTEYKYADYKVDLQGYGNMGFRIHLSYDHSQNRFIEVINTQTFPQIGMPAAITEWQSLADNPPGEGENSFVIRSYTFNTYDFTTNVDERLYVPYIKQRCSYLYDYTISDQNSPRYDSKPFQVTISDRTIDEYGNITYESEEDWTYNVNGEPIYDKGNRVYRGFVNASTPNWLIGLKSWEITTKLNGSSSCSTYSTWNYDSNGNVLWAELQPNIDEQHLRTDYLSRDEVGNVTKVRITGDGINARETNLKFDTNTKRFLEETVNPLGWMETAQWNGSHGAPTKTIDQNGLITLYFYDDFGRKIETRFHDGTCVKTEYLGGGFFDIARDGNIHRVQYVQRQLESTFNGYYKLAPSTIKYIDRLGRVCRVEAESGVNGTERLYSDYLYDWAGRLWLESKPYIESSPVYWTEYRYDFFGRVLYKIIDVGTDQCATGKIFQENRYSGLTHEVLDDVYQVANPGLYKRKLTTYNTNGSPIIVETGESGTSSFQRIFLSYDASGNHVQTTDASGFKMFEATYNDRGFRSSFYDTNRGLITYKHDALGNVLEISEADGTKSTFTYDSIDRLTAKVLARNLTFENYYYQYDTRPMGKGKIAGETASNGWRRDTYYILSGPNSGKLNYLIERVNGLDFRFDYEYDSAGRNYKQLYPGVNAEGHHTFAVYHTYATYDQIGQVFSVQDSRGSIWWSNPEYSPYGHLYKGNVGPYNQTLEYSPGQNLVTSVSVAYQTIPKFKQEYKYDNLFNLISRRDSLRNLIEYYSYDKLSRLIGSSKSPGTIPVEYEYDTLGNISRKNSSIFLYDATKRNRLSWWLRMDNHWIAPLYDNTGNILSYWDYTAQAYAQSFSYTLTHQPAEIWIGSEYTYYQHDNAGKQTFEYDVVSTKYSPGSNFQYVIKGSEYEYRYTIPTPLGATGTYVNNSESGETVEYLFKDVLSSLSISMDGSGSVISEYAYDCWGWPRNPNTWAQFTLAQVWPSYKNDMGFTSHDMQGQFRFINMGGRHYDPQTSRFLSTDILIQNPTVATFYNPYAYALNNPFRFTDPTGLAVNTNWGIDGFDTSILSSSVAATSRFTTYQFDFRLASSYSMNLGGVSSDISLGLPNLYANTFHWSNSIDYFGDMFPQDVHIMSTAEGLWQVSRMGGKFVADVLVSADAFIEGYQLWNEASSYSMPYKLLARATVSVGFVVVAVDVVNPFNKQMKTAKLAAEAAEATADVVRAGMNAAESAVPRTIPRLTNVTEVANTEDYIKLTSDQGRIEATFRTFKGQDVMHVDWYESSLSGQNAGTALIKEAMARGQSPAFGITASLTGSNTIGAGGVLETPFGKSMLQLGLKLQDQSGSFVFFH